MTTGRIALLAICTGTLEILKLLLCEDFSWMASGVVIVGGIEIDWNCCVPVVANRLLFVAWEEELFNWLGWLFDGTLTRAG